MPSPIVIDMSEDQSAPDVPGVPDQLTPRDEPPNERSPLATPIAEDPAPFADAGEGELSGPVPQGDGTSGSAYGGIERSWPTDPPSTVTTLPSTGTGQSGPPGGVAIGALVILWLLLLLRAVGAVQRERG